MGAPRKRRPRPSPGPTNSTPLSRRNPRGNSPDNLESGLFSLCSPHNLGSGLFSLCLFLLLLCCIYMFNCALDSPTSPTHVASAPMREALHCVFLAALAALVCGRSKGATPPVAETNGVTQPLSKEVQIFMAETLVSKFISGRNTVGLLTLPSPPSLCSQFYSDHQPPTETQRYNSYLAQSFDRYIRQ